MGNNVPTSTALSYNFPTLMPVSLFDGVLQANTGVEGITATNLYMKILPGFKGKVESTTLYGNYIVYVITVVPDTTVLSPYIELKYNGWPVNGISSDNIVFLLGDSDMAPTLMTLTALNNTLQ